MQKFTSTILRNCTRASFPQASLYSKLSNNFGVSKGNADLTPGSDLIEDIRADHKACEGHYANYKAAKTQDEAHRWFNQFMYDICRHSVAEELIIYSMMEMKDEKGKKLAEASRQDHRQLKVMLEDLRKETDEKLFEEKFDKVYQTFQDHVKDEESEDHAYIRNNISATAQQAACKAFALKKNLVPTRPHPEIPDKPTTLELALGMMVYPADKLRDLFTPFPEQKK